jgi:hypothetical protein
MTQMITGSKLGSFLEKLADENDIRIAVAFWGDGACEKLKISSMNSPPRIICNLQSGGTNPDEIKKIKTSLSKQFGKDAQIRQHNKLHAKVYMSNARVVVGSSNASANGLSMQGRQCSGWAEANIHSVEPNLISETAEWFEALWTQASYITEDDLETAKAKWIPRRRTTLPEGHLHEPLDLFDELTKRPENYVDQNIWLVFYGEPFTEEAEQKIKEEAEAAKDSHILPEDVGGFENWKELPDEADLVCFETGKRTRVSEDGIWRTPKVRKSHKLENGNDLLICYKSPLKLSLANSAWKAIIRELKSENLHQYPINDVIERFFRN